MQTTTKITLLAARAASILMQWSGVSPLRKNDNGDRESKASGFAMLLGAMADKTGPLAPDMESKIAAYIETQLLRPGCDYSYYTLSVDYGPDQRLAALTEACELVVSWPIKSNLSISFSADEPGYVGDSQGYRAPTISYSLVPEREGWLITEGFGVDRRIRPIVVDAIKAGSTVATFEPIGA
jgi:hypothetical protein